MVPFLKKFIYFLYYYLFLFGYIGTLLQLRGFSLVVACRLSCSGACGILVPRPGIKPESPALEGRFFTTRPPGKSLMVPSSRNLWQVASLRMSGKDCRQTQSYKQRPLCLQCGLGKSPWQRIFYGERNLMKLWETGVLQEKMVSVYFFGSAWLQASVFISWFHTYVQK